jgi:hypothetical protein
MRKCRRSTSDGIRGIAAMSAAIGAVAVGAFAIGALAIGRLAVRRLLAGEVELESVRIRDLAVDRLLASDVTVRESLKLPEAVAKEDRPGTDPVS